MRNKSTITKELQDAWSNFYNKNDQINHLIQTLETLIEVQIDIRDLTYLNQNSK